MSFLCRQVDNEENFEKGDKFDKMDLIALRAYIINSVKEVNRIKHKLKTKNSYFKLLYNKFVKRRMKKTSKCLDKKEKITGEGGGGSSSNNNSSSGSNSNSVSNAPTDMSSDENFKEKEKIEEVEEEGTEGKLTNFIKGKVFEIFQTVKHVKKKFTLPI